MNPIRCAVFEPSSRIRIGTGTASTSPPRAGTKTTFMTITSPLRQVRCTVASAPGLASVHHWAAAPSNTVLVPPDAEGVSEAGFVTKHGDEHPYPLGIGRAGWVLDTRR
jgi:hypothetical protein